jgi:hypothetical protein
MYEKLLKLYPQLSIADFHPSLGTIVLQDDGQGAYIKEWNHPTLARPTNEELA